ncbi:MAG: 50S ribosomal protein L6 [Candidatus Diapherotrites archaeon]|nr:50S ribosomal protein L6 [Candidatus Diapherotrites archaeon]
MIGKIVKKLRLPSEAVAVLDGAVLTLKGPKGQLKREFKSYRIKLQSQEGVITVEGSPKNKQTLVLLETICAHIRNMTEGVVYGYKTQMKVVYSHFPMSLTIEKGFVSVKNFLGEKFPRKTAIIGDTKVEVKGQDVIISGIDKEAVGQTATNLEKKTKVKDKDIRRFQDGIYIVEVGNIIERKVPVLEEVREKEKA